MYHQPEDANRTNPAGISVNVLCGPILLIMSLALLLMSQGTLGAQHNGKFAEQWWYVIQECRGKKKKGILGNGLQLGNSFIPYPSNNCL